MMKKWDEVIQQQKYLILPDEEKKRIREGYINASISEKSPDISENQKQQIISAFYEYADSIEPTTGLKSEEDTGISTTLGPTMPLDYSKTSRDWGKAKIPEGTGLLESGEDAEGNYYEVTDPEAIANAQREIAIKNAMTGQGTLVGKTDTGIPIVEDTVFGRIKSLTKDLSDINWDMMKTNAEAGNYLKAADDAVGAVVERAVSEFMPGDVPESLLGGGVVRLAKPAFSALAKTLAPIAKRFGIGAVRETAPNIAKVLDEAQPIDSVTEMMQNSLQKERITPEVDEFLSRMKAKAIVDDEEINRIKKTLNEYISLKKEGLKFGKFPDGPLGSLNAEEFTKLAKELAEAPIKKSETFFAEKGTKHTFGPNVSQFSKPPKIANTFEELSYPIKVINDRVSIPDAAKIIEHEKVIDKITSMQPISEAANYAKSSLRGYARSVNLDKQNISDAAKAIQIQMAKEAGPKVIITHQEIIDGAYDIIKKFEADDALYLSRMAELKQGTTPTVYEQLAVRIMNSKEMEGLSLAARDVANGKITSETFDKMYAEIGDRFINIVDRDARVAGQTLNARKISVLENEVAKQQTLESILKLNKELNPRQRKLLAEVDWSNETSVQELKMRMPNPKAIGYIEEIFYNNILAGWETQTVNAASNTLWKAFRSFVHDPLVAGIDKLVSVFRGGKRDYFMGAIVPKIIATYGQGLKKGLNIGRLVLAKDIAMDWTKYSAKMKEYYPHGIDLIGKFETGVASNFEKSQSKIVKLFGRVETIPTRLLRTADVVAKISSYEGNLVQLAFNEASKIVKKGTPKWNESYKNFIENPTKEMLNKALEGARNDTFTDLPGHFTQRLIKLLDTGIETKIGDIKPLRFFVPFVNTLANIVKRGVELTPGLGLVLARGKSPAEVIALQIEGSVLAALWFTGIESDIITTNPKNEAMRKSWAAQGITPNSIKIGNTYFETRRIEPFNAIFSATSAAYDAIQNAKDDDTATQVMGKLVDNIVSNYLEAPYIQGISNLIDKNDRRKGMGQRMLANMVPLSGFWRSLNRGIESMTEKGVIRRDTSTLLGAFSQVIPGLSSLATPKISVWGEEISVQGNIFRQWSPFKFQTETEDKTEKVFGDLGYYPGTPSRFMTINGVKEEIPEKLWTNYAIASGRDAKQWVDRIVNSPSFPNRPPDYKLRLLNNAIEKSRERYKNRVRLEMRNYISSGEAEK